MNKKVYIIILLLILFVVSIPLTIAYIKVTTNTDNIITFGSLKMKLTEYKIEKGEYVIINNNDSINILDENNINRFFIIENICKESMFVRISFDINGISGDGNKFDISNLVNINSNSTNWIYKDGWYYYKDILKKKKNTEALNIELVFDIVNLKQKYPGSKINLKIKAEALQSKNNSNNVLDAKGWPS